MSNPDGWPAFPIDAIATSTGPATVRSFDMSLRDYFAGQALNADFLKAAVIDCDIEPTALAEVATFCYRLADAMLKAAANDGASPRDLFSPREEDPHLPLREHPHRVLLDQADARVDHGSHTRPSHCGRRLDQGMTRFYLFIENLGRRLMEWADRHLDREERHIVDLLREKGWP